jgi:hypothetical protein
MRLCGSKRHHRIVTAVVMAAGLAMSTVPAAAQPLRRDLGSYFLFALKFARLKNLSVDNACNVGVDCAAPSANSECGELIFDEVTFADGSQAAGDRTFCTKPGATLFQLFKNSGGPCNGITVNSPPISPFDTPIIPGTCDPGCLPDYPEIESLCGFPDPFPPCGGAEVRVKKDEDCTGAPDAVPNNGRCDLAPGQYGDVRVRNFGKLNLSPGDYNVCNFRVGRNALVVGPGAVINIPGGSFRVGGSGNVGQRCGDLTVRVKGDGTVTFGRGVTLGAKVCAPESSIKLGHGNTLLGQFVGDQITSNRDNHGQCCGGRCACIDAFAPEQAHVGDVVTLTGICDLSVTTGVKICGIDAAPPFVSKTATELKVTVPVGAIGPCTIEVLSSQGSFVHNQTLTVN